MNGDVYGHGFDAIYNGVISNVAGNVLGLGVDSLRSAQITNVSKVFCAGNETCADTTIRIVNHVKVSGNNTLGNAKIISELASNNVANTTLHVTILSSGNTDDINVYCNETDTCIVECETSDGCTMLRLYCYGTCSAICSDSSGIDCPVAAFGNYCVITGTNDDNECTNAPTANPTVIPTVIPTVVSSAPIPNSTAFEMSESSSEASTMPFESTEDTTINGMFDFPFLFLRCFVFLVRLCFVLFACSFVCLFIRVVVRIFFLCKIETSIVRVYMLHRNECCTY